MFIRQISNHTIAHIADNNIELLATVPSLAFGYAQYILNGKFELGEEAIASNVYYSVLYAEYVLHDRFELAEPEIAKCANFSLRYAIHVLKGPFPISWSWEWASCTIFSRLAVDL